MAKTMRDQEAGKYVRVSNGHARFLEKLVDGDGDRLFTYARKGALRHSLNKIGRKEAQVDYRVDWNQKEEKKEKKPGVVKSIFGSLLALVGLAGWSRNPVPPKNKRASRRGRR